jgi:hypothetical protein
MVLTFTIHHPKSGLTDSYRISDPVLPLARNTGMQGFTDEECIPAIQNFIPDDIRYCNMDFILPSSVKECFFREGEIISDYETILTAKEVGSPYIKGCFRGIKTKKIYFRTARFANIEAERKSEPSQNKDYCVEIGPLFNADVSFWTQLKDLLKQNPKLPPQQMTVFKAIQHIKDRDGWFTLKDLRETDLTKDLPHPSIRHDLQQLRDKGILKMFSRKGTSPKGTGCYKLNSEYI